MEVRAFSADVPAKRRPLPVDLQTAGVLRVEGTLAVAQPADEGTAAFLPEHVAVRLAPGREGALHHARKPARDAAEEAMARIQDFI